MGLQRVRHDLATKQQQQGTTVLIFKIIHLQVSNGARIQIQAVLTEEAVLTLTWYWWCGSLVTKSCPTLTTPWTVARKLLYPWDFPGKSTGVSCHFLLQDTFPIQELNLGFLHWQDSSLLSHTGSSADTGVAVNLLVKEPTILEAHSQVCCSNPACSGENQNPRAKGRQFKEAGCRFNTQKDNDLESSGNSEVNSHH